jgi:hypothetical protein
VALELLRFVLDCTEVIDTYFCEDIIEVKSYIGRVICEESIEV